jgi:hypothetical protein
MVSEVVVRERFACDGVVLIGFEVRVIARYFD